MREELLHFIWRHRYFKQQDLFTESGETLQILSPGEGHADQGPDFRMARIRIGDHLSEGPVELHVRASDWVRHAHDGDAHYRSIILHVVWTDDLPGAAGNIPVLALEPRVPKLLLTRLEQWMDRKAFVPCERQLSRIAPVLGKSWLQELAERRLQRRAIRIGNFLEQNRQHWEETTWLLLARSMGQPVNGAVFEAIAQSLPTGLLVRHRSDRLQLEALLLGQAGLLEGEYTDAYPVALQQEYRFLRSKWGLCPTGLPVSFLRMRPAHFPTIRLAQLADLFTTRAGWFALIREAESPAAVLQTLHAEAGGYWQDHYLPDRLLKASEQALAGGKGEALQARPKRMGIRLGEHILINAFIPVLYAYGWLRDEPAYREKALCWLRGLTAERNVLIDRWRERGMVAEDAADTQGLLELRSEYCVSRRCLDCAVGRAIICATVPAQGSD
jgi:uncharacterized protein DUF2851